MEFNVSREVLLEGIQKTLGIVEKRTTMPILNNVLIRAGDNHIRIIATNREIGLISDYDAQVSGAGEITLSARKLYEMVREIQEDSVSVRMNDSNWVSVRAGKVEYKIPGVSVDDFPAVTDEEGTEFFKIKAATLLELIRMSFFAMSTEEMRINLNGALIETEAQDGSSRLRMVTTDGHRLAHVTVEAGPGDFLELSKGIIIPRKGVIELRKLLEDKDEEVEIGVGKGACMVRRDKTLLKISLIDADYPDYRKVIPGDAGNVVVFDREQMLRSLKRMSVISSEKYHAVKIKVSGETMLLQSQNPDIGEAYDEVGISRSDGEIDIGYNVNYLIDAIEVIDEKDVVFEIRDGLRPATIRGLENKDYLCIIMPLKI